MAQQEEPLRPEILPRDDPAVAQAYAQSHMQAYTEHPNSFGPGPFTQEDFERFFNAPNTATLAYRREGRVIAAVSVAFDPSNAGREIRSLFRLDEAAHQHLGSSLLRAAIRLGANERATDISLWVAPGNTQAIELYRRAGFKKRNVKACPPGLERMILQPKDYARAIGKLAVAGNAS